MEMTMGLESDLIQLDDLTDDTIRDRLRARYERDLIYTKVSDILIAINPCKTLPIYDTQHHNEHRWDNFEDDTAPHVFSVAAAAYRRMRETETDQVIIVSGESGAGKTESTKYMVHHMVHMCQGGQMGLNDKILKVNPLLEAFGNAKTMMNNNSSRFAKFLELRFDKTDRMLQGAVVRDYMLEKSRVVHRSKGEGTFHIFYALFAGCPKDVRNDMFLTGHPSEYRIMQTESDAVSLDMEDHYKRIYRESMDILKQLDVDTDVVHSILASVIHLADIGFMESDNGNAEISDAAPYCHAAILLDLDEENLGHSLIASKRIIKGQNIAVYKTVKQAENSRDALAKMLYERMFGWLVRQINKDLHAQRSIDNITIGILDIAGFENLKTNSFEQMCINLVNEKLQSFMTRKIFSQELEIYKSEGIQLEEVEFKSNEDVLELFEKDTVGVFAILDETTRFQQGTDMSFVHQLNKKYNGNRLYTKAKGDRPEFGIKHFAAQVWYDARNFLEKNRDSLNDELVDVMKSSGNQFISDLFTVKRGPTGTISREVYNYRASKKAQHKGGVHNKPQTQDEGKQLALELGKSLKKRFGTISSPSKGATQMTSAKGRVTLTSYFKNSLDDLLGKIGNADPFFVRCLKANGDLVPDDFDSDIVSDQLKYNGIAEIAKIRKMGYPVRKPYTDFLRRYRCLQPGLPPAESNKEKVRCILLLTPVKYHRDFRCGKTKAFLTETVELWLEKLLYIRQMASSKTITRSIRNQAKKNRKEKEVKGNREDTQKREADTRQKKATEPRISETEGTSESEGSEQPTHFDESSTPRLQSGRTDEDRKLDGSPVPGPSIGTSVKFNIKGDSVVYHRPPSPQKSHDTVEHNTEDTEKTAAETKEFWDICQIIARERRSSDVHEQRGMQVIKVVTYMLLFLILLFCAVAQKISLVILTSNRYDDTAAVNRTNDEWITEKAGRYYLLAIAIMIPYGLVFITSIMKWIFGNFFFPKASTLFLCFLFEGFHSVGLCLLCFDILQELDMIHGLMILSGVALMPAILRRFFASEAKLRSTQKSTKKRICIFSVDLIALFIQCGYIPLVLMTGHFNEQSEQISSKERIVEYACAIVLISFSWWENFADNRLFCTLTAKNHWYKFIMSIKFDLQESRPIVSVFMSLWKIGLTCLMCWALGSDEDADMLEYFNMAFDQLSNQPFAKQSAIVTLTLTAFVGHYVGYTACKLRLQSISYNIPLVLSTPLAVLIVSLHCQYGNILTVFTEEQLEHGCTDLDLELDWWHYLAGLAVLWSLYWIGRHIFFPNIERLAKTERLFMNPFYCGVLFEQHMVLNRRRHNRKVYREFMENKMSYRLTDYDTLIEGEEEVTDVKSDASEATQSDTDQNSKFRHVPMIYACATMWHENRQEMLQLLKSLFRMDRDQLVRRHAEMITGKPDREFYDFEAHIFFDDAMELNDDEELVPNQFVKLMVSIIEEAASCVYEKHTPIEPPTKVPSPYGGQLIWTMPGDNFLYLHLKDKQKIRHRKRWSQVMYMYYLLGFRMIRHCDETVQEAVRQNKLNELVNWGDSKQLSMDKVGLSHIFSIMDYHVAKKANNTFLLALDGDVDFTPGAVRLLLDRMRKSKKVGASCGRIHPIGTGPIVWFQKFEYAIAHWLQKATEHVLGCVLCSPGCFSLFRGSALMDDNVMKKYTILPTEPVHHLMYDQGEDRWLCTLLLQQGYRVDYAAGSDAYTYAPEGFAEFFNQRRRWMPSTIANIVDLLADYKNTIFVNSNISMLYIFYQAGLLISSVLGPATVLMMIAGANLIVFQTNLIGAYSIALCPAVLYFIICFLVKPAWQIVAAEILSGFYAFVMMIVFVGTIVLAAQESPFHPSVIFIAFLVFLFSFAALLHPKEWTCALYGVLYFLCIPAGFLILVFYSLINLHIVSWGTREIPKKKTKAEIEAEKQKTEEMKKKKKEQGFFAKFFRTAQLKDFKDLLTKQEDTESVKLLKSINEGITSIHNIAEQITNHDMAINVEEEVLTPRRTRVIHEEDGEKAPVKKGKGILKKKHVEIPDMIPVKAKDSEDISEEQILERAKPKRDELKTPAWLGCSELGKGPILDMEEEEIKFWRSFVRKYLKPLDMTEDQKKTMHKGLIELRNNVCLGMVMINILWIAINFMFQFRSPTKINIQLSETQYAETEEEEDEISADPLITVDVLGLLFIIFFVVILLLQFVGMIIHRWGTFLHLVSITELPEFRNPFKKIRADDAENTNTDVDNRTAMEFIHKIISEPFPDYPSDDDSTKEEDGDKTKREITQAMKTGSRFNISVGRQGVLGASSRALDQTDTDITGEQRTNLAKSANLFRGDIQKRSSRFDQTPATDNIRQKFQDDYLKRKDRKYKDSHLPLVKEKNKFHLGPSKQKVALQLRQTYYDTKDGLLIPENNDTMLSTSNFVQKKGTLGRAIGRKLFLLAQGGQNVYDIPQSEAFAVAGSVRLFPNTKQKRVTQDASNEREFSEMFP